MCGSPACVPTPTPPPPRARSSSAAGVSSWRWRCGWSWPRTPEADAGRLVPRGDEASALQGSPVVVDVLLRAIRQLHLLPGNLPVRNLIEDVANDVQPRSLLVVGRDDEPRAPLAVRCREHRVPRSRVLEPLGSRREIGPAQLPLPHRILDARLKAAGLLVVADLEPVLEEHDPALEEHALEPGDDLEEAI